MSKVKHSRKRPHTSDDARERQTVIEHKSGDHVFNKGVKTIYYDIVNKYFEDNGHITCFHDRVIDETGTPTLYKIFQDKNWPFSKATVSQIDEMKVPSGKKDKPDDNSIFFGEGKRNVVDGIVSSLSRVIGIIKKADCAVLTPDKKKECNQLRENLKDYLKEYTPLEAGASSGKDGFYVDQNAKEILMKQPEFNKAQFEQCKDAIIQVFQKLVDAKDNDPEEWLIYILAKEILHSSATRSVDAKMPKVRKVIKGRKRK